MWVVKRGRRLVVVAKGKWISRSRGKKKGGGILVLPPFFVP